MSANPATQVLDAASARQPDRRAPSWPEPGLVVTRTPLRVSFAGGGTDLPSFYERGYGAVLSTAIDKYLYVTVKRHGALFNEGFRLNYSQTEQVQRLDEVKNNIARECLRFLDVEPPVYISTVADLPEFSGLGSSSSFAVGLLNALHAFRGERISAGQLAEEASRIEIDVLGRPIGKQDQYAAAFGGLNFFRFLPDGQVTVEPQRFSGGALERLFDHLLMFWTGIRRDSTSVLAEQQRNTEQRLEELSAMRDHAQQLQAMMRGDFDPLEFGRVLDATWTFKRRLASNMTNERIDGWYRKAKAAGAAGGKLCGAGGGGFLLFVASPAHRRAVRGTLRDLMEVPIRYESQGSRLLLPFVE